MRSYGFLFIRSSEFGLRTKLYNYLQPYEFVHALSGIQTGALWWLQSFERLHVTLDRLATTASIIEPFIFFYLAILYQHSYSMSSFE